MTPFPFHSLLVWSKKHGRHGLPWRSYFHLSDTELGYHIWLSEILLQQTQVDRVIGYYESILKRFPTIESLASATYDEFFPYYKGLGYYSRARNMIKTAKIVTEKYHGVFPNNPEELIKLPGVGPYTVAAIRAFAYNESVLSFDTNLEKIFSRFYYGTRFQKLTKNEKLHIEKDFQEAKISGREINAAFMDFGSQISINNKPQRKDIWEELQKNYPLSECRWIKTQGILEIQEKKKKKIFPTKDARIIITLHENHKIYYSSDKGGYKAFVLPPTEDNVRHFAQEYFRTFHNLEISVRPVHESYFENDIPFIVCNAQIQKGIPLFDTYSKENGVFSKNI